MDAFEEWMPLNFANALAVAHSLGRVLVQRAGRGGLRRSSLFTKRMRTSVTVMCTNSNPPSSTDEAEHFGWKFMICKQLGTLRPHSQSLWISQSRSESTTYKHGCLRLDTLWMQQALILLAREYIVPFLPIMLTQIRCQSWKYIHFATAHDLQRLHLLHEL